MTETLPFTVQRAVAVEELFALNEIRGELSDYDNKITEVKISASKARIQILDELINFDETIGKSRLFDDDGNLSYPQTLQNGNEDSSKNP
tara:strand:- start:348 stop:617 length:270 start_codon:yes stop_codon:yes gene_type:complete